MGALTAERRGGKKRFIISPSEAVRTAQTTTARIERAGGYVVVRIEPGVAQTLDDARTNLAAAIDACDGIKRPLLVDISCCAPLEPAVRHHYSGEKLVAAFRCLALLVEGSPFGRMMGNVYLRIARPGIPTRLFEDEARARTWCEGFRA